MREIFTINVKLWTFARRWHCSIATRNGEVNKISGARVGGVNFNFEVAGVNKTEASTRPSLNRDVDRGIQGMQGDQTRSMWLLRMRWTRGENVEGWWRWDDAIFSASRSSKNCDNSLRRRVDIEAFGGHDGEGRGGERRGDEMGRAYRVSGANVIVDIDDNLRVVWGLFDRKRGSFDLGLGHGGG